MIDFELGKSEKMAVSCRSWFVVTLPAAVLLLAPLAATRATGADAGGSRPNIVFMLADDLGWSDLAVYGSKYYLTPNIDQLAAEGCRFTCYHTSPNCQPTLHRAHDGSVCTAHRCVHGGQHRSFCLANPAAPTGGQRHGFAARSNDRRASAAAPGYATGMFGKWHLGDDKDHHPLRRGFDEAIVTGASTHFDFTTNPPTRYPLGQYLADFLTDRAVDFMRRHKDEPFFLYLPHYAVHAPHQAKEELIARFRSKPGVGGHNDPTYAAMITSVDESVGRVMQTLDQLQLADRTVLIFSSDNGGVGGYRREGVKVAREITDNAPLRSGKGSLYEGGTRVPLIVRWPGVTRAGSTCSVPTIHVDVLPTLQEIAGADPPPQPLDGESLVKLLRDPGASLNRGAIYQHFPGYLGAGDNTWRTTPAGIIQAGDWKLLEFFEDGRWELYHLQDDLGEQHNLAGQMPDKAAELHEQLLKWRAEIGAPMPRLRVPKQNPSSTREPPSDQSNE